VDVQLLGSSTEPTVATKAAEQIVEAFATGRGAGVLHLAVVQPATELPQSLSFWREVGRAFVARACAMIDPTNPGSFVAPEPDLDALTGLVDAVPPMQGAEHLDLALLVDLWADLGVALGEKAATYDDGVQGYLAAHGSAWHVVGRVCFHLAENKNDLDYPFAFMATYVHKVSKSARPQYLPLGRALDEYVGAKNKHTLLSLLAPLSRAAAESEFIRDLVDSGDIYHPLAWGADDAHRFLCEIAIYEKAGLVVRVPDWWSTKRKPRARVTVTVGGAAPSTLGTSALLDFHVGLAVDGVDGVEGGELDESETNALLAAGDGLVLIKGKWVEVDHDKLTRVLDGWRAVQRRAQADGVTFGEAVRMLAGIEAGVYGAAAMGQDDSSDASDETPDWSEVVAGPWLAARLEGLRSPVLQAEIEANAGLRAELRPYQKRGVQWLANLRTLGLGGCLADDMGLGKTIQVIGALNLSRGGPGSHNGSHNGTDEGSDEGTDLLVVPASLVDNWRLELERFAPELKVLIAHPSRLSAAALAALTPETIAAHDAVITTYGTALRAGWMKAYAWRNVILDEAQAIKNPSSKQTHAIKALSSRWRLALTGTPVENSLGDLWSIFDFLNPGLLGSVGAFSRSCRVMAKSANGHAPLRRLLQPYILRRLKTDRRVIADLPDKTEVIAHCLLTKRQVALYQQTVDAMKDALEESTGIERRGMILAYLMRFKQICNHPSQWLGDNVYAPGDSGKVARLRELCESIAARQDKVLVFTQFREMTEPLAGYLAEVFGRDGLVLHGGTPVKKRQDLVRRFQDDDTVPFMVLSLKAGGTGLNLTAASHVIHFDRWWNPAVENQATDRAFRIGQKKNVLVHKFVCRGTVEEKIDALLANKQRLSDEVLSQGGEKSLTELGNAEILAMVSLDLASALDG